MSSYSLVEPTLWEILGLIQPKREDWGVRFHIIQDVRDAVQTVESLRGATVEPFGSFVSHHFTKGTDLNISIETHIGPCILNMWRNEKKRLLEDVLRALRSKGTWGKLRLISTEKVTILKLEHKLQNILCYISINDLHDQMKSQFLFWINGIDERFRDMVLLVKEWAKRHALNESKSESLNSYCLSLLVIFHFQTCVPAILPPLQQLFPGDFAHDLSGVRTTDAVEQIARTFAANKNRFLRSRRYRRNQSSLSDLLVSFFAKFSDIDVRASEQGINPYSGQWEDIGTNMAWLPQNFALYVEDPFQQPENTAKNVSSDLLTRIADAFRATHRILSSNDHNQATRYAMLARQEWLHVTRSSARNPGNYNRSRPEGNRAVSVPSESRQARNTRNPAQSNNANRGRSNNANRGRSNNAHVSRSVQPSPTQTPQIWRPKGGSQESNS